ncbi:hypothetical protein RMATCC62417_03638 [Rhizopus microsporus]|nr:hypothetical protein RMATCC62417_03638 [Rhizopus microsporus]
MLTKVGGWEPIMLLAQNGKAYHFLASPDNFDQLLVDQPSGKWMLPKPTNVSTESTLRHSDDLFHLITSTSPFYKFISNQSYIELSKDIVETLNNDWTFNPQLRFACSQAFAGAILLEGFTAIIINCVEPYGRLKKTDAHHERRLESSMHSSSYPQTESKYGWISSVIVEEDNVTKLKIGTTSFNLLVTSSIRLDNKPNTQDIIQMGSKTTNFVPTVNTSIYLDKKSIELANSLLDNQATVSINQQNRLFQLKQIRSKFDCLSSYTMCRSFSTIATNMMFRPYTIFTLCEYDSPQVIESQAQKLSTMFQSIAHSVINDGAAATVSVDVFQKVHDQLPHDSTAAPIISQIIALSEYGRIRIINNTALESLLQPLAKSMVTSIRNANNIAVKLLSRHLQT